MESKRFFTATDKQEMLGVSLSYAYKLIRKLNAELEAESRTLAGLKRLTVPDEE